jgi:ankyrin repeat protein
MSPSEVFAELSFATLFLDEGSDRPECESAWLRCLPPLAATLHQLTLANVPDHVRYERALQALGDGAGVRAIDVQYGRSVLHWACLLAHPDLVALLLHNGATLHVNQPDAQGLTPLACLQSLRPDAGAAVAGLLLAAGASLASLPYRGAELLYLPGLDAKLTQYLLRAGANIDGGGRYESTPLMTACGRRLWGAASMMLESGANIYLRGPFRTSVLHHAQLPVWLAEQLYRRGADVNARDLLGETPLMLACREGNIPLARWLLAKGASVAAVSDDGLSASDCAGQHGAATAAWLARQAVGAGPAGTMETLSDS